MDEHQQELLKDRDTNNEMLSEVGDPIRERTAEYEDQTAL
jgi:hypothetical protein